MMRAFEVGQRGFFLLLSAALLLTSCACLARCRWPGLRSPRSAPRRRSKGCWSSPPSCRLAWRFDRSPDAPLDRTARPRLPGRCRGPRGDSAPAGSWTIPWAAVVLALAVGVSAIVELALMRVRMGPEPFKALLTRLLEGRIRAAAAARAMIRGRAVSRRARAVRRGRRRSSARAGAADPPRVDGDCRRGRRRRPQPDASGDRRGASGDGGRRDAAGADDAASTWSTLTLTLLVRFAMLLCLAVGLTLITTRRARAVAIAAALVLGLALWLTSSRAAILGVLAVGGAVGGGRRYPHARVGTSPAGLRAGGCAPPARHRDRARGGLLGFAGLTVATWSSSCSCPIA